MDGRILVPESVPAIGCSEIPPPSVFAFAPYRKFAPLKVKAQQSVPSWMAVKIAAPPYRFNFLCFNCPHKNLAITAGLILGVIEIYRPPHPSCIAGPRQRTRSLSAIGLHLDTSLWRRAGAFGVSHFQASGFAQYPLSLGTTWRAIYRLPNGCMIKTLAINPITKPSKAPRASA